MTDFALLREFGASLEDAPAVVACLKAYFEKTIRRNHPDNSNFHLRVKGETFHGAENVSVRIALLDGDCLSNDFILSTEDAAETVPISLDQYDILWKVDNWKHVYEFNDQLPEMVKETDYCFLFRLPQEPREDSHNHFALMGRK